MNFSNNKAKWTEKESDIFADLDWETSNLDMQI
jgi:hypothetical protein